MKHGGYREAADEARAEIVRAKSRFVAILQPVRTHIQARSSLSAIRALHPQARHIPYAVSLTSQRMTEEHFSSDDGEPRGSSGAPIVAQLLGAGLTNTAIFVVRYFGGKKLGLGNLSRAYGEAAHQVLAAARTREVSFPSEVRVIASFPAFRKLEVLAQRHPFTIHEPEYGVDVRAICRFDLRDQDRVSDVLLSIGELSLQPENDE